MDAHVALNLGHLKAPSDTLFVNLTALGVPGLSKGLFGAALRLGAVESGGAAAAATALSLPSSTGRSLPILNPSFIPRYNAVPRIFEGIRDQVMRRLAANPRLADEFVQPGEWAILNGPSYEAARALEGTILERAVAAEIASFRPHAQLFKWTRNIEGLARMPTKDRSIWDFSGIGHGQGFIIDVTTPGELSSHVTRWYGDLSEFSLYTWPR
jgi:hypothetical protein